MKTKTTNELLSDLESAISALREAIEAQAEAAGELAHREELCAEEPGDADFRASLTEGRAEMRAAVATSSANRRALQAAMAAVSAALV